MEKFTYPVLESRWVVKNIQNGQLTKCMVRFKKNQN